MIFPRIDKKKTGARIKQLMNKAGITPAYIAEYLSLGCVQTVYRWFGGINIPNVDNLYALSHLFHVTVDDMLVGAYSVSDSMLCGRDSAARMFAYCIRLLEIDITREF